MSGTGAASLPWPLSWRRPGRKARRRKASPRIGRGALVTAAILLALGALYQLRLRDVSVAPGLSPARPVAAIGSGSDAVAVAADGSLLTWAPVPDDASLPLLPLGTPPERGGLRGPMLQQTRVLGAAPAALRPYIQSSGYGTNGVAVDLDAGIELRFGDASSSSAKWRAAATVLADPAIYALDYVDLRAPTRPAVGGSGQILPAMP